MAFTVTFDSNSTVLAGKDGGDTSVSGTAVSTGGDTGGVVSGATVGIRNIRRWGFTCNSGQQAAQVVKTYSAAVDSDILTITTAANATYDFWIEGKCSGNF